MMFDVKMVLGCLISYYPCTSMVYLIHLHTFTYIYIHLHICVYTSTYIYTHLHTFTHMYHHSQPESPVKIDGFVGLSENCGTAPFFWWIKSSFSQRLSQWLQVEPGFVCSGATGTAPSQSGISGPAMKGFTMGELVGHFGS